MIRMAMTSAAACVLLVSASAPHSQEIAAQARTSLHAAESGRLRPTLERAVVEGCQGCHRGNLDLGSHDPEALAQSIQALIGAATGHPVPIPELSEDDVLALAEALTAGP